MSVKDVPAPRGAALMSLIMALAVGCVPDGNGGGDGSGGSGGGGPMARDEGVREDIAPRLIDRGVAEANDAEVDACVPSGDDVCNGLDDDCDGVADEDFGVGGACTVGEGACAATGVRVCADDGTAVCDVEAGAPGAETCNEADDDCDGTVDEGFDVGVACMQQEAECVSRGFMVCSADGGGTECGAAPIVVQEELCNEADDDCDGEIDEGIVLGGLCEVGIGLCRRGGFTECAEDGQIVCSGQPGPPGEEACNGFDDDCDGVPDEDFGGEPCQVGIGACLREGFRACTEDGGLQCNVVEGAPTAEVCNDIDDDCDGTVDEGYAELLGEPCTVGEGVCAREAIYQCDPEGRGGGYAFEGIRQNVPLEEILDGGFEECFSGLYNGNENIAGILADCSEGVLLLGCMPNGADALTLAAMGERGEVLTDVGNVNNAVHNHNGVDWYFNDSHSWGFAGEGDGVSRNSCDTADVRPELRMCWHTSNGSVSSGYRCGNQILNGNAGWTRVVYHKPDGPGVICDVAPGEPVGADECNGQDDDCDGLTDEETPGLGEPCEGIELEVCQAAQIGCTDAGEIECVAVPTEPQPEFCNAIDDDCDGAVDEDFALGEPCAVGTGACAREGVTQCDDLGGAGGRLAFEGIRQDVPFDELRAAGFEPCWEGHYGERAPAVAQILEGCNEDQLLLGCGPAAAETLQLAATGDREQVLTDVGNVNDAVHNHNGVDWYFNDAYSWGFAGEGDGVSRNSCDTAQVRPELRMCWHTGNGTMSTGYRCGARTVSDASFRRVIWHRPGGAGATCSVEPGEPQPEACNAIDDDCDELVDEEVVGTGEVCDDIEIDACQAALTACVDGEGIECVAVDLEPGVEFCNAIDDDCDGTVDEDFAELGQPCVEGVGICAAEGVYECQQIEGGAGGGGAGLPFEGIQQDVPLADLEADGFAPCWSGLYGGNEPIAPILEACGEGILLLGCRPVGADALTLAAAGLRDEVLTDVGNVNNAVHNHNGVDWYFNDSHSWGFAGEGDGVSRNSCDTANVRPELRMCWHTSNGNVSSGYRCGGQFLNGDNAWERVIYQRPDGPGMVCSAQAGEPLEAEICNGDDDDCDGEIDEEIEGVGGDCFDGIGACERGVAACDPDGALMCLPVPIEEPSEELCNGFDDDCDGEVDNLPGAGDPCGVGVGACAAAGTLQCPPDGGVQLVEGVMNDVAIGDMQRLGFEQCYAGLYSENVPIAGILEGCPGEVMLIGCREAGQENLRTAAMGLREDVLFETGDVPAGVHEANGVNWYYSDLWSWGFAPAGAVVNRNSCDVEGPADETRMCWHTGNGNLNFGWRCGANTGAGANSERFVFVADRLGGDLECVPDPDAPPPAEPVGEACNAIDDDCDGTVDEDFDQGGPCAVGVGACRAAGVLICDAGGERVCGAEPGEPGVEACNGIDDDCDARIDEELDCP